MRRLLAIVVVSLVPGRLTHAQERVLPLDSGAVRDIARLGARFDTVTLLRVRTMTSAAIVTNPRLVPSGLSYASLDGTAPQLAARTFELQTRGRATVRGATIGAVALGLVGAALGASYSGLACLDVIERDCNPPALEGAAAGFVVFGAVGGAIGALVGRNLRTWRTFYRYPE